MKISIYNCVPSFLWWGEISPWKTSLGWWRHFNVECWFIFVSSLLFVCLFVASFEQVMPVLGKVPVFPTLLTRQPSLAARARQSAVSLLEWIDAQVSQHFQRQVLFRLHAVPFFSLSNWETGASEMHDRAWDWGEWGPSSPLSARLCLSLAPVSQLLWMRKERDCVQSKFCYYYSTPGPVIAL